MQGDDGGVTNLEVHCAIERVEACCSDQGSLYVPLDGAAVESYSRRVKVTGIDLVQHGLLIRIDSLGIAPGYACHVEMEGCV